MRASVLRSATIVVGLVGMAAAVELPTFSGLSMGSSVAVERNAFRYGYVLHVAADANLGAPIWYLHVVVPSCDEVKSATRPPGWFDFSCWQSDAGEATATWLPGSGAQRPERGSTVSGFSFTSGSPPGIGEASLAADLGEFLDAVYAEDRERAEVEWDVPQVAALQEQLTIRQPVLVPIGETVGSFAHWDRWLGDLEHAAQLGWIADPQVAAEILAKAREARNAAGDGRWSDSRASLEAVMAVAQSAPPGTLTPEGTALVLLNAQALREAQPVPYEPALELSPSEQEHALGETAAVTARLENRATHEPLSGRSVCFAVTEGPHAGLSGVAVTGGEMGTASWSYVGRRVGEDTVTAALGGGGDGEGPCDAGEEASVRSEPVAVRWSGGPDLRVTTFTPEILHSAPGRTFVVNEATVNVGNLPAPPTVTRYYISTTEPVDPATAVVAGERQVPALDPQDRTVVPFAGGESRVTNLELTVPQSLPPGWYHLVACADADDRVVELDESNNCSSSGLLARVSVGYVQPVNRPPDCSGASVSPAELWPPNHRMVGLAITGITDPDGDPVTVTAVSVRQDEPVTGVGEGNTAPDATLSPLAVRAERMGRGDGRVYHVEVRADDGKGGSCTAHVSVCVPHDRHASCTDGGSTHDSTQGGSED